jgi:hypothetical protein
MEHTNDPTRVFEQYAEGVVVHEDKTITISPEVQKDILDCTAGLMHEHRKLFLILTIILAMASEAEDAEETLANMKEMLTAYFEDPSNVQMHATDDPHEVKDIIGRIQLLNTNDEVEN